MQSWQQFYEMIGGAGATLLGLLFVSVSLNAEQILGPMHKHSKRLAEQAFQNYLAVLLISLVVVFPGLSPISLGSSLLWMAGIWGAWAVARALPSIARPVPGQSWSGPARRYLATVAGFGMLVYEAAQMVYAKADHPEFIAIGAMMLLLSATIISWELLIRIAEDRYRERGAPSP
ncbi:MAG: hypothetical protein JOZ72_11160 [Alphaproteobacteria bacterium]|nr:hypothetical protein [Alphaproteobacteria bacterium]